jgi:uncharacterized protein
MKRNPSDYRVRTYRSHSLLNHNLIGFNVTVRETDLFIYADSNLTSIALSSVHRLRSFIESYITSHREFLTSLMPVVYDEHAPGIVREMIQASSKAGVGPMAAVAGAIAEYVARDLCPLAKNVIIENGGDIYLNSKSNLRVGIFAERSHFSRRLSLKIRSEEMPLGICTSSATVGHSLSFGKTDACCVKSKSVALADAAATAIGNIVKSKKDLKNGLEMGMKIDGVLGVVIIIGDELGAIGDIEFWSD